MRRPHLSTGAWIFASVIAAAIVAPTAVYAAASSTVAIGNAHGTLTATVTANHQLLTTTVLTKDIVHTHGSTDDGVCTTVYTPPAGDAIVVTSVTYHMYSNTTGGFNAAWLTTAAGCGSLYDVADTDQKDETESRTFPTGLPMPSVGILCAGAHAELWITGYLIPASGLPATPAATKLPAKLTHPTH